MIAIVNQHSAQLLEKLEKDARIIGTISDDHPGTVFDEDQAGHHEVAAQAERPAAAAHLLKKDHGEVILKHGRFPDG